MAGTVSPDGSLEFTEFWTYGPFTANSAGDAINANFEQTFASELDAIIILQLPGQKSRKVIGPFETIDVVSFSVRKVAPLGAVKLPSGKLRYYKSDIEKILRGEEVGSS